MPLGLIPFMFLAVPILEITVFILVGNQIGLFPTLGMILVTAVLGTLLLRHQGLQLFSEIKAKTEAGEVPGRQLVHGVLLLVAGIFLLTPGFVTDSCGFLLFVPAIRDAVWRFLKDRVSMKVMTQPSAGQAGVGPGGPFDRDDPPSSRAGGPTIDLDETEFGPAKPDSPWRDPDRP
ncbi:MAG: FxsA family protein [Pseudomonadota bacterium]